MFRKQACICLRSTGNWWNTRLMTEDTGNPGSVKEPVESLLNTEGDKNLSTGWISAKKSQRFQCGVLSLGMSVIAGQVKDTVQKTYNASQLHVGWNYFISACICLTIIRDWQKKKKKVTQKQQNQTPLSYTMRSTEKSYERCDSFAFSLPLFASIWPIGHREIAKN